MRACGQGLARELQQAKRAREGDRKMRETEREKNRHREKRYPIQLIGNQVPFVINVINFSFATRNVKTYFPTRLKTNEYAFRTLLFDMIFMSYGFDIKWLRGFV